MTTPHTPSPPLPTAPPPCQALDICHVIENLSCLAETKCVCQFLSQLSLFKHKWCFAMPALHSDLIQRLTYLSGGVAAVVSRRSNLKQIVRTLNAAGLLAPEDGPLGSRGRCGGREQEGMAAGRDSSSPRPTLSWMHDE